MQNLKKIGVPISRLNIILYCICIMICYVLFVHVDIIHTGCYSMGILYGHLGDLYDYNYQYGWESAYPISTYVMFALWNIPLRLIGFWRTPIAITDPLVLPINQIPLYVIWWMKLLPIIFFVLSAWVIYKIAFFVKMSRDKSILSAFAFLTTPIAFLSSIVLAQYDTITVFFVLMGVYYYLKQEHKKFVFFFAIAITFKLYALLFFIILLLLNEKKIIKICMDSVCVLGLYFLETLFSYGQGSYADEVVGFDAIKYVFQYKLEGEYHSIYILHR